MSYSRVALDYSPKHILNKGLCYEILAEQNSGRCVFCFFGVAVWLNVDPWFTNKEAERIGIAFFILCAILLHAIPQIMSNFVSILIAVGVGLAGWLIVDPWYST